MLLQKKTPKRLPRTLAPYLSYVLNFSLWRIKVNEGKDLEAGEKELGEISARFPETAQLGQVRNNLGMVSSLSQSEA